MKDKIHPDYGPVRYECACGNVIESNSTRQGTIKLDICSGCHPFFTGKQKLIDSAGRVERFYRKYGRPAEKPAAKPADQPAEKPADKPANS